MEAVHIPDLSIQSYAGISVRNVVYNTLLNGYEQPDASCILIIPHQAGPRFQFILQLLYVCDPIPKRVHEIASLLIVLRRVAGLTVKRSPREQTFRGPATLL